MQDWKTLQQKIGPLRYQTSKSDCVPTTVINGLLMVTKAQLNPKLQKLIWNVSLDSNDGPTGWVSCQLLSDTLNAWFKRADQDKYESKQKLRFKSEILDEKSKTPPGLDSIRSCLKLNGVACITTEKGTHYSLIVAEEGDRFLGFDPWWSGDQTQEENLTKFEKYCGLINVEWEKEALSKLLAVKKNRWIHLVSPL